MQRIPWILSALSMLAILVTVLPDAGAQRRRSGKRLSVGGPSTVQQLLLRIDHLEQRVTALERLTNAPVAKQPPRPTQVNVVEVEQQLAEAEARLKESQSLLRRGFASEAKVEANEFEVKRARLLVELGKASQQGQPIEAIAAQIDILAAERDLAVATRRLDLIQRLASRGFALPADVDAHKLAVEKAQERLRQAGAEPVPTSPPPNGRSSQ